VFNLGMGEITVILLLALIFLGPTKLPELAAGLGKMIRELRKVTSDVKNEITLDDTFRKPFEELRDAVTLHPEELKRRDRIRQELEDVRRRSEELARAAAAADPAAPSADVAPAAPEVPAPAAVLPPPSVAPDTVPAPTLLPSPTPPAGTVARRETLKRVSPTAPHAPPRPPFGPISRVVPPMSAAPAVERSNTTQFLTEEDLMPSGPATHAVPPPVPGSGSGKVNAVPVTQAGKVPLPGAPDVPGSASKKSDQT
jgi:sec-independent protein translocase protein TatB